MEETTLQYYKRSCKNWFYKNIKFRYLTRHQDPKKKEAIAEILDEPKTKQPKFNQSLNISMIHDENFPWSIQAGNHQTKAKSMDKIIETAQDYHSDELKAKLLSSIKFGNNNHNASNTMASAQNNLDGQRNYSLFEEILQDLEENNYDIEH